MKPLPYSHFTHLHTHTHHTISSPDTLCACERTHTHTHTHTHQKEDPPSVHPSLCCFLLSLKEDNFPIFAKEMKIERIHKNISLVMGSEVHDQGIKCEVPAPVAHLNGAKVGTQRDLQKREIQPI